MDENTGHALQSSGVGRKRTKELPATGTVQITLRLPVDVVRELDREVARIARENFGAHVERTEIIRRMVIEALARRKKK